jgi:hypothetical protein
VPQDRNLRRISTALKHPRVKAILPYPAALIRGSSAACRSLRHALARENIAHLTTRGKALRLLAGALFRAYMGMSQTSALPLPALAACGTIIVEYSIDGVGHRA